MANPLGGMPALPPGGQSSDAKLLPAVREAGNVIKQILADLRQIDQLMSSIGSKTRALPMGGGSGTPGGTTHSNGMPRAVFGSVWDIPRFSVGSGGMVTDSYAPPGALPPGGGGGVAVRSNGMPVPRFAGALVPTGPGGGGGDGGGGGGFNWSPFKAVGKDIVAAVGMSAISSWAGQAAGAYADDTVWNRLRVAAGGNGAFQRTMNSRVAALYNGAFLGHSDLVTAASIADSAGLRPSVLNPQFASGVSSLAMNGGISLTSAMQASAAMTSNPMMIMAAKASGIDILNSSGQANNPMSTLNQVINYTHHGGFTSKSDVDASFGPVGMMRRNLRALGWSDDQIAAAQNIAYAQVNAHGASLTSSAFAAGADSRGLKDTLVNSGQKRASAQEKFTGDEQSAFRQGIVDANASIRTMTSYMDDLNAAMGGLLTTITGGVKGVIGGVSTTPMGGSSVLGGAANMLSSAALEAVLLRGVLGKTATTPGMFGSISNAASASRWGPALGLLGRIGAGAGIGMLGLGISDSINNAATHGTGGHWWQKALHVLTNTAIGAGTGLLMSGNPLGAVLGGAAGFGEGLYSSFNPGGGMGLGAINNMPDGPAPTSDGSGAGSLLQFAERFLGTPYSWGGGGVGGPSTGIDQGAGTVGFDCSSFVQYVFAHYGVALPRRTYDQAKCGRPVSPDQARAGDLVFLDANGHVGIYMGNGTMIHAPHTGDTVRISSVNLKSASAIRRVLADGVNVRAGGSDGSGGLGVDNSGASTLVSTALRSASAVNTPYGITSGDGLSLFLGGALNGGSNAAPIAASAGGGGSSYGFNSLVALAKGAGFSDANARTMAAIALAESGGNPMSHNSNAGTGDNSYGLWQINMLGAMGPSRRKEFGISSNDMLFNSTTNASAAMDIFKSQGFNAWSTYKSGAYLKYLPKYDVGAWRIPNDHVGVVHKDEMILPKKVADVVRSGAAGGDCKVTIIVNPSKVDQTTAVWLAKMVKENLDHENHLAAVGTS